MKAQIAQRQLLEALNTGMKFLKLLSIEIPESPQFEDIQVETVKISQAMEGKKIADLAHFPLVEDRNQSAKIGILSSLLPSCYQAKPDLFPWVVCKLMQLSIQYGNTSQSAFIYACYGMICILVLQDFVAAREYGKVACKLDENSRTGDGVSGTFVAGACIAHYSVHIKKTLPLLSKSYQAGLEKGNFQQGGYSLLNYTKHFYFMGANLNVVKREMSATIHALTTQKQGNTIIWLQTFEQGVLNLLGESEVPWELAGTADDENQFLQSCIAANDRTGLHIVYLNKLILCYLFEQIPQALENTQLAESYLDGVVCYLEEYVWNFYDSLTQLAHYPHAEISEQQKILQKVAANQIIMNRWVNSAPMNARHKYDLVAAEQYRVLGNKLEAMEKYSLAIAGAKENEYIQEQALANELFAKFYLNWGREKEAAVYMQEGYYCYARWGSKAKTDDLEKCYPQMLGPILQRPKLGGTANKTISDLTKGTVSNTNTSTGELLDLASLMKASRSLSQEIDLKSAIANFMHVIQENAGAETVALMLFQADTLMLKAHATGEKMSVMNIPVETSNNIPLTLINQVKNTGEHLVLDNAKEDNDYGRDNYIQKHQPQSVLCLPLIDRGQPIGILYLENNQTSGAFTGDRIEILNLLCSQAAIALQNAQLYDKEQWARNELQQALTDLQQAQLQLVQSEKMATLGNLVAGVAHEINNPVGFVGGNIEILKEELAALSGIIEGYRQEFPEPSLKLAEKIEELDLEGLLEDIPQIIGSMQEGCERIRHISTSLRTFSRTDTEKKTELNLHDGIDSTLLILKYRLKANLQRPSIEIVKKYGELPEVKCYPGQLNQVFMNLLANAIDAIEESNEGKIFQQIEKKSNQITIVTELSEDNKQVIVQIADNGMGMPEEVKARLFEQGFTTKGVGKGTGLGMAIAHQIVTEKHGGKITCDSTVGQGTIFTLLIPR